MDSYEGVPLTNSLAQGILAQINISLNAQLGISTFTTNTLQFNEITNSDVVAGTNNFTISNIAITGTGTVPGDTGSYVISGTGTVVISVVNQRNLVAMSVSGLSAANFTEEIIDAGNALRGYSGIAPDDNPLALAVLDLIEISLMQNTDSFTLDSLDFDEITSSSVNSVSGMLVLTMSNVQGIGSLTGTSELFEVTGPIDINFSVNGIIVTADSVSVPPVSAPYSAIILEQINMLSDYMGNATGLADRIVTAMQNQIQNQLSAADPFTLLTIEFTNITMTDVVDNQNDTYTATISGLSGTGYLADGSQADQIYNASGDVSINFGRIGNQLTATSVSAIVTENVLSTIVSQINALSGYDGSSAPTGLTNTLLNSFNTFLEQGGSAFTTTSLTFNMIDSSGINYDAATRTFSIPAFSVTGKGDVNGATDNPYLISGNVMFDVERDPDGSLTIPIAGFSGVAAITIGGQIINAVNELRNYNSSNGGSLTALARQILDAIELSLVQNSNAFTVNTLNFTEIVSTDIVDNNGDYTVTIGNITGTGETSEGGFTIGTTAGTAQITIDEPNPGSFSTVAASNFTAENFNEEILVAVNALTTYDVNNEPTGALSQEIIAQVNSFLSTSSTFSATSWTFNAITISDVTFNSSTNTYAANVGNVTGVGVLDGTERLINGTMSIGFQFPNNVLTVFNIIGSLNQVDPLEQITTAINEMRNYDSSNPLTGLSGSIITAIETNLIRNANPFTLNSLNGFTALTTADITGTIAGGTFTAIINGITGTGEAIVDDPAPNQFDVGGPATISFGLTSNLVTVTGASGLSRPNLTAVVKGQIDTELTRLLQYENGVPLGGVAGDVVTGLETHLTSLSSDTFSLESVRFTSLTDNDIELTTATTFTVTIQNVSGLGMSGSNFYSYGGTLSIVLSYDGTNFSYQSLSGLSVVDQSNALLSSLNTLNGYDGTTTPTGLAAEALTLLNVRANANSSGAGATFNSIIFGTALTNSNISFRGANNADFAITITDITATTTIGSSVTPPVILNTDFDAQGVLFISSVEVDFA